MKHAVIVKHIHVLAQPITVDEIRNECPETDDEDVFYFSNECGNGNHSDKQVNKWLHAAQIGKIVYDEDKGFFQNDIEYTHIAYYGHEFAPHIEDDLAPYPSSPLIKYLMMTLQSCYSTCSTRKIGELTTKRLLTHVYLLHAN